jgi:uncharacterized membrane protein
VLSLLAPLVLLTNGLAGGVLLGTLLGGWPLLAALPDDRYVHAHAFFATRYDPAMPACLLGTLLGDIGLAVITQSPTARWLFLTAAVLAAFTIAISITKNVPTNKWIQTLDPQHPPGDLGDRKYRWGVWNRRRSVLTLVALLANCSALAVLL